MRKSRSAWLAVNLSMWFPGLGQIYAGEMGRGIVIVFFQGGLMTFGLWHVLHPAGQVAVGFFFLFGALVVHAMGLIDTYERMPPECRDKADPWKHALFSQILPGLGQFFQKKWGWGLLFFIPWAAVCHPAAIKQGAPLFLPLITSASAGHALLANRPWSVLRKRQNAGFLLGVLTVWFLRVGIPYGVTQGNLAAYYIPSESMEPTLEQGDRILVKRTQAKNLLRGDVTVFRAPDGTNDFFVKRLIGLPGDTLWITHRLWINGRPPDHPVLKRLTYQPWGRFGIHSPFLVPEGNLFFLGDNSPVSIDSRLFGPVPEKTVIGRAYKILLPISRSGPIQ